MGELQCMTALARANEVRFARAEIKRRMRAPANRADSAAVLADALEAGVPAELAGMTMDALLRCVFKSSPEYRRRMIAEAQASPTRVVGALSSRQVGLLVAALRMSPTELSDRAWTRSRGRAA